MFLLPVHIAGRMTLAVVSSHDGIDDFVWQRTGGSAGGRQSVGLMSGRA